MQVILGLIIGCFIVAALALILALPMGWLVMMLWNAVLPALFGVSAITFWQSVGLYLLCTILFKTFSSNSSSK